MGKKLPDSLLLQFLVTCSSALKHLESVLAEQILKQNCLELKKRTGLSLLEQGRMLNDIHKSNK